MSSGSTASGLSAAGARPPQQQHGQRGVAADTGHAASSDAEGGRWDTPGGAPSRLLSQSSMSSSSLPFLSDVTATASGATPRAAAGAHAAPRERPPSAASATSDSAASAGGRDGLAATGDTMRGMPLRPVRGSASAGSSSEGPSSIATGAPGEGTAAQPGSGSGASFVYGRGSSSRSLGGTGGGTGGASGAPAEPDGIGGVPGIGLSTSTFDGDATFATLARLSDAGSIMAAGTVEGASQEGSRATAGVPVAAAAELGSLATAGAADAPEVPEVPGSPASPHGQDARPPEEAAGGGSSGEFADDFF
jgi:hypothetical protein